MKNTNTRDTSLLPVMYKLRKLVWLRGISQMFHNFWLSNSTYSLIEIVVFFSLMFINKVSIGLFLNNRYFMVKYL